MNTDYQDAFRPAISEPQVQANIDIPYVVEALHITARCLVTAGFDGCDKALVRLYTLLCMSDDEITRRSVHNAWALWKAETDTSHPSLIPFDDLSIDTQFLDEGFRVALMFAREEMADRGLLR